MAADNRFSLTRVGIESKSVEALFRDLVRELKAGGHIPEEEAPLQHLVDREEVQTTAIGGGVALPHARCSVCEKLVVSAALLKQGIDFEAPDGKPVDLVFLILGPEEPPGEHVMLLGRLARMISRPGLLDALRGAPDEASFRKLLEEGLAAASAT